MNHNFDIRNCDCMELMAEFPDNYFDLAIVDPPYGIDAPRMSMGDKKGYPSTARKLAKFARGSGKLKNRVLNQSNLDWDVPPPQEYFTELFRVSENLIIWGANYFSLPPTRGIIVWDKLQPWPNFSQVELAWTSFDRPAAKYEERTTGGANTEPKIHPTQKPVGLYRYLISRYAKPGDTILDTHLGSGSIAIAAHEYDVHLTASEINTSYYQASLNRLNKHTAQTTLPLSEPLLPEIENAL